MIYIRPMTEGEFRAFREVQKRDYAESIAKVLRLPIVEAQAIANEAMAIMLKGGIETSNNYFYSIVNSDVDQCLGSLWFSIQEDKRRAQLCWIGLEEHYRGKGIGRTALEQVESLLQDKGIDSIDVHAFINNGMAIGFYQTLGFWTTGILMHKDI